MNELTKNIEQESTRQLVVGQVIEFVEQPGKWFLVSDLGADAYFTTVPIVKSEHGEYLQGVGSTHLTESKFRVVAQWDLTKIMQLLESFYRIGAGITEEVLPTFIQDTLQEQKQLYQEKLGTKRTI